jgi:hypothetical protein
MGDEKGLKDVAHYGDEPFVDSAFGTEPPVGAWIAKEAVCRDCMTASEEISMRRGFIDPVSVKEAREEGTLCTRSRCGDSVPVGP